MAEIKPAEISAILKKQVEGFESGATLEEVGSVLQVGDGIARVYGLSNVQYGELVEFENGLEGIVLNLEEDNVGVVLLGPSTGIKEGSTASLNELLNYCTVLTYKELFKIPAAKKIPKFAVHLSEKITNPINYLI